MLVKVRGGTEAYLAWSEQPLATGTEVLVYNARGDRALDVMEFSTGADGASSAHLAARRSAIPERSQ